MAKVPISFEVYPPRSIESAPALYDAIDRLSELNPNFISVTFGAGGHFSRRNIDKTSSLLEDDDANRFAR